MKWGILSIGFIVFPTMGFVFHWLSFQLPIHPVIWFYLLARLEYVIAHIIAWPEPGLRDKIPYLAGLPLFLVIVFAFFRIPGLLGNRTMAGMVIDQGFLSKRIWSRMRK